MGKVIGIDLGTTNSADVLWFQLRNKLHLLDAFSYFYEN